MDVRANDEAYVTVVWYRRLRLVHEDVHTSSSWPQMSGTLYLSGKLKRLIWYYDAIPEAVGYIINHKEMVIQNIKAHECGYIYINNVKEDAYSWNVIWCLNAELNPAWWLGLHIAEAKYTVTANCWHTSEIKFIKCAFHLLFADYWPRCSSVST